MAVFVPNRMHIGLFRANSILLVQSVDRGKKRTGFKGKAALLQVLAWSP